MKKENSNGVNKNILLAVILIPVLVAVGVVAGYYFTSADQAGGESVFAKEEEKEAITVPLEEFLVNMKSSSGSMNYVRMEITLSGTSEEFEETVNANLAKVRDAVIHNMYLRTSDSIFEETEGMTALKNTLKDRINDTLGDDFVNEVYITNIVMQ
ncbi:flagellar basal body-associated FliL family protein [Atopococcus tabaci]|uniref:flagellar basal body-associated FliL family protein n=1 Tax=Atopococcus tabaci TaxID=269774 RepID=UPI0004050AA7|nr:flagellar basal body-associated FliL family protein [Atopococcus tabaci]